MPGPDYSYTLYDKGYIQLGYDFRFAKDKKDNPLYILDWPADGDSTRYNLLPSTAEALSQMMDSNNSYRYTQQKREHQWQLTYNVPLAPACDLKLSACRCAGSVRTSSIIVNNTARCHAPDCSSNRASGLCSNEPGG